MQFCNLFVIIRITEITKCNLLKEVTVIFKDLFNKETLIEILSQYNIFKKSFDFIKNNRILMKICCLCLVGMLAVGISIVSAGITLGFKVNYAGSFIATIRNAAVFDDAKCIVADSIESSNPYAAIEKPSFSMTLTVSDRLDSAFKLAKAIIENTSDITEASALIVNGETVVCTAADELEAYLEYCRTRFEIKGAENTSEFAGKIEVKTGYYLKSEVSDFEDAKSAVEALEVKTVSVISSDSEIPFSEKTVKDSGMLIGSSKITTAGENGIRRKTESVEAVNGTEVLRTELSNTVVKEPVEQVKAVGTAKTTASAAQRSAERSAGFICPLKRGTFTVSAYFGDGRGHKGIDLAADKGSPIYAVAAGTVTFSGYDGNYGYSVVIDHGNGLKTRYAHASALKVSSGTKVEQGDLIALVGSTGYSTGNHLHFEVIVNGNRVNPISYIGLD